MADEAAPATKKKFRKFDCSVAKVVKETHDSVSLFLATSEEKDYKAGQFVSIDPAQFPAMTRWTRYFEKLKGRKEPPRMYSLGSAPYEEHLIVTIKAEEYHPDEEDYPPLFSPHAVHGIREGERVSVMGYAGQYFLPDDVEKHTDHVVHICSGSGIVPNYGMVKQALHDGCKVRHTLIDGNKTIGDVIYLKQFADLAAKHPDRFKVIHAISREDNPQQHGSNFRKGRVTEELIREFVPDPKAALYFCCGAAVTAWEKKRHKAAGTEPKPKFMDSLLPTLEAMGVPKERVHKESW